MNGACKPEDSAELLAAMFVGLSALISAKQVAHVEYRQSNTQAHVVVCVRAVHFVVGEVQHNIVAAIAGPRG